MFGQELFEDRLRRQPGRTITDVGDFDLLQTLRRAPLGNVLTPGQLMQHLVVSSEGLSGPLSRQDARPSASVGSHNSVITRCGPP
jgi:hypothetical protein